MGGVSVRKWEVYLAYVRYEDIQGGKLRPVLVIDENTAYPICCLKMTSHQSRAGEYELIRWQNVGLRKPTTVRIQKRLQLDKVDFKKKIGLLDPIDILNIEMMLQ